MNNNQNLIQLITSFYARLIQYRLCLRIMRGVKKGQTGLSWMTTMTTRIMIKNAAVTNRRVVAVRISSRLKPRAARKKTKSG